jgi:hypothetical protein
MVGLKDTSFTIISEPLILAHSPSDIVSKIYVQAVNFSSGERGIEFICITTPMKNLSSLRLDSMELISSTHKLLTINKPYRDTIFNNADGGVYSAIIHFLTKSDQDFVLHENINEIVLMINENPLKLKFDRKAMLKWRVFAEAY